MHWALRLWAFTVSAMVDGNSRLVQACEKTPPMIGYIEGKLLKMDEDRILLLANQVGYEVLLPSFVMETVRGKAPGEPLSFYIYYQQTERQPKPILIGFNLELEKDFFQHFISVEAIGAIKAVKAMTLPVHEIAAAIESRDVIRLKSLKGIGERTARKIIASLRGRMEKFLLPDSAAVAVKRPLQLAEQTFEVLVEQLGYQRGEARKMIAEALERNTELSKPEELLDEIFRSN